MANKIDWDAIEPARSALRTLVANVELELAKLRDDARLGAPQLTDLSGAFTNLVRELALGAEPPLRECPSCSRSILQEAVRCRYCMRRSPSGA